MSAHYKPCLDCGRKKEGDRRSTLYCGTCYEARYEARAKAASLCGDCSDHSECEACKQIVADKAKDAALRSVQTRRKSTPGAFRPDHADKKFQVRAVNQVQMAIRKGILPRLSTGEYRCTDCSGVADTYDHRDYGKPLDVEPVCRSCNWKRGTAKWPQDEQIKSIMAKKT